MRYPAFCGGSYRLANPIAGIEQAINWYPQVSEQPGAKADVTLEPCPGFTPFCTLDKFPIRGLYAQDATAVAVADDTLYDLASNGTFTARASGLSNDGSPVTIVGNGVEGQQLWITSGSKGFVYDISTHTLTQELNPGNFGGFLDGFFLALDISTAQLRLSAPFDGTTWDPTQFAQRTFAGDAWKALCIAHRQLWLFGSQTSEPWYNAGTSPFPFAPTGTAMQYGIVAPYSLALLDDRPVWLAQNAQGQAMVVQGNPDFTVSRLSDFGVEYALAEMATLADAIGWVYQERGHTFYVLQTETGTWVFDGSTKRWHQRGYWNVATGQFDPLRVQSHMFAFGKHLVGDRQTGAIYQMSSDLSTDVDGTGIRRVRRAPHIYDEGKRLVVTRFQLDMQVGLGAAVDPGSDPQMMLKWSGDGGATWGSERPRSFGKQGAYQTRVIWGLCGSGRDLVPEVTCSEPVPVRLVDAWIDVEACVA